MAVGGFSATVVSIIVGILSVRSQLQEQVVLEYTGRFSAIIGSLPYGALEISFEVNRSIGADDWNQTLKVVHQYFDLCSEELKLSKRGRVPRSVWEDWTQGIVAAMKNPLCQTALKEERFAAGYQDLRKFLAERNVSSGG